MPDKNNIEVMVVVSGQSERLKVNVHQTLEHLVHEALQKSGNQGQAPSEWELRTEDEPPSVEFIDPFTGEYTSPPVQALVDTDEGPRDLVVHSHRAAPQQYRADSISLARGS